MTSKRCPALMALVAALVVSGCGSAARLADPAKPNIVSVATHTSGGATDHHCADLFAQSVAQLAPVHGVWNCLEPAVQAEYNGNGDEAIVSVSAYFLAPVTFIGCSNSLCVYSLPLEATTAAELGISQTTMTVWLDDRGLVAYAAVPRPLR
jgi:hypothetical protein